MFVFWVAFKKKSNVLIKYAFVFLWIDCGTLKF